MNHFWLGDDTGSSVNGLYEWWSSTAPSGRPNDADGARSEAPAGVDMHCSDGNPFVGEAY